MRMLFVDTFFWVASINPRDSWYSQVNETFNSIQPCILVTTEEVLTELLNFYSSAGRQLRQRAIGLVEEILASPDIEVMPQTHQSFLEGVSLYGRRLDKGYSLPDCISMNTMRQLNITEALTRDKHFAQEGFTILFTKEG